MPAFVEFDHVYKRYKMGEVTITANDDVSFAVNKKKQIDFTVFLTT